MGRTTFGSLFEAYAHADITKGKSQLDSDKMRRDIWTAFFAQERVTDPMKITKALLDRFVALRRQGLLEVKGHDLSAVRGRPVEIDLQYLRKVYSWASAMGGPLERNPMKGYENEAAKESHPRRPKVGAEYYRALRAVADKVEPQKLYLPFVGLVESLGWRVEAVCELRANDLDLRASTPAPYGRVRKRGEVDKEGVEQWVPLSRHARAAVDLLMRRRPAVGAVPLFPAPRSKGAWSRHHARKLLYRAERLAGIEWPGGERPDRLGYHAFRRLWRSERRHFPDSLVAKLGGWKSVKSLEVYDVVEEQELFIVAAHRRRNGGAHREKAGHLAGQRNQKVVGGL